MSGEDEVVGERVVVGFEGDRVKEGGVGGVGEGVVEDVVVVVGDDEEGVVGEVEGVGGGGKGEVVVLEPEGRWEGMVEMMGGG